MTLPGEGVSDTGKRAGILLRLVLALPLMGRDSAVLHTAILSAIHFSEFGLQLTEKSPVKEAIPSSLSFNNFDSVIAFMEFD